LDIKKIILLVGALSALITLALIGYVAYLENRVGDELETKSNEELYNTVIKEHEIEKKSREWIDEEGLGHSHNEQYEDIARDLRKIPNVLTFLAQSIYKKDHEYFSKVFEPNQLSKDLVKSSNPNKPEVLQEMMSRISRGNKLEDIALVESNPGRGKMIVDVTFLYSDDYSARVELNMKYGGGQTKSEQILYITSSIWSVIDQIEKN